jgi:hypothetical protein
VAGLFCRKESCAAFSFAAIMLPITERNFARSAARNFPLRYRRGCSTATPSKRSIPRTTRFTPAKKGAAVVSYDSFFYPLDAIRQWNLLYGRQGFLQYQCVIPESNLDAFEELLDRIAESGMGSFLGVLKQFGHAPAAGMLSFPRPGLTIALDFAMRGERTLKLMQALDEIVLKSGGALYPAKDARMSPALFEASYPRWRSFRSLYRSKDVFLFLAARDGSSIVCKKSLSLALHPGLLWKFSGNSLSGAASYCSWRAHRSAWLKCNRTYRPWRKAGSDLLR